MMNTKLLLIVVLVGWAVITDGAVPTRRLFVQQCTPGAEFFVKCNYCRCSPRGYVAICSALACPEDYIRE